MRSRMLDSILHGQWRALTMVALFSTVFNVLMLTSPIFMLAVFSNVLTSKNVDTLLLLSLAAGGALLVQGVIDYVRMRLLVRVGIALDLALAPRVIEAMIIHAGPEPIADRRPLADASEIRRFVSDVGVMSLIDLPFVPLYLLVIGWLHPALGVLGALAAIMLLMLALINDGLTRRPAEAAQRASRRSADLTVESLINADAVRSMGMTAAVIERCRRSGVDALDALQRGADRAAIARSIVRTLRIGIQMALYGVGAWLFLQDQLMVGAIVASSVLLGRALSPLEYVVFAWRSAMGLRQAHRRLGALLDQRPALARSDRADDERAGALVEVRRASVFAPESNQVLLNGISLSLAPGELLGVIGPVGAGKSTLGRLLVGLIAPRSGLVMVQGRRTDGVRSAGDGAAVGYCGQAPQLLSGTIADNISRFSGVGGLDTVVRAAQQLGLHDRIEALPDGYSTRISAEGFPLSAGLRQQVALARAFYGDPALIVLDEPAAWVDQATQTALSRAIERARERGAGVVVITHQPTLLRSADRIAVMRGGAIELLGPRDEVLRQLAGQGRGMARRGTVGDPFSAAGNPPGGPVDAVRRPEAAAGLVNAPFALARPLNDEGQV
ncbi:MAG: hypothetical protein RL322_1938 [Pseudomonadota bacterium]